MKLILFLLIIFSLSSAQVGRTSLEIFLPTFRAGRRLFMDFLLTLKNNNVSNFRKSKIQKQIPETSPFPCGTNSSRSSMRPTSVHRLKPGDIDVVGALGDSLIAGIGPTAISVTEILIEERGKTFSIGGDGTWRTYMTLPNILKVFNPKITGYSLGNSLSIDEGSQLNVAEASAISADTPYMAKVLISRIAKNSRINFNEDWKMITIFIGANDFCGHMCYADDPFSVLEQHRTDLIRTLRLFRDKLPRTFVNVISGPHMDILVKLKFENSLCEISHLFECPCFFGSQFAHKRHLLSEVMTRWQKIDMEVCDMAEFDKDDFTVVYQPFVLNYTIPSVGDLADESYFAPDCFHFSQKFHARIANNLWNNIMEPVNQKSSDGSDLLVKFLCPTEDKPYIFTKRNSF